MQNAHLQVTSPEGASGMQTADLKVEVPGFRGGKPEILRELGCSEGMEEKSKPARFKKPKHAAPTTCPSAKGLPPAQGCHSGVQVGRGKGFAGGVGPGKNHRDAPAETAGMQN
jgi:hypothetical protein